MVRRRGRDEVHATHPAWACPYCSSLVPCPHFIGWTTDGKIVELRMSAGTDTIRRTDIVRNTGVSYRVYRHPRHPSQDSPASTGRKGVSPD